MNIKQLCKEAHENTVEKGFYDCRICDGYGEFKKEFGIIEKCHHCENGKDPNINIGEKLMLIVSELGEALEAHRNNKYADWDTYNSDVELSLNDYMPDYQKKHIKDIENGCFKEFIKDSFEDEIADVFIRLFELCGYLGIKFELNDCLKYSSFKPSDNIGETLFFITEYVINITIMVSPKSRNKQAFMAVIGALYRTCQKLNIPIEKHIQAKMAYNKTRPHKHDKDY